MRTSPAPLSAELVLGRTPALKEPQLLEGVLYWLEQRPQEQGRTTLMARRPGGAAEELTPGPWNLRCRVHEYGGGACAIGRNGAGNAVAVFVHDGDRCLWRLDLGQPGAEPQRLTPCPAGGRFNGALGGGVIDAQRQRWIGVLEQGGRDQLVAVSLGGGAPQPLHPAQDFCGYPVLSPDGMRLAWVEWQQPHMPWERSQLWLAAIDGQGQLEAARPVAGSGHGSTNAEASGADCSVFQPLWAGTDLVVANDRSGFWNLERWPQAAVAPLTAPPHWQALLPMAAEFAMPQWVFGMATTAWDGERLLAMACRNGRWQLGQVALPSPTDSGGHWTPIDQPFCDLAGLSAEAGRIACVASGPSQPSGLLELELAQGHWSHTPAAPCPLAAEAISQPEELWFAGHGDQPTQAWYYPPQGGGHPQAPLLVKGHSGPTGMARTGLSLSRQYGTSRGWGVVDVADCAAAANAVVERGLASTERIAIEGGSAGGFTTLAALCFTDRFRAGASRYGVADLSALAADTHRFEARYLDGLVGPWPAAAATYAARSPLQHADRIRCPVIFFQGLEDVVVPPEQTERMADALRRNGIPVEVHLFADEGHGFRNGATQVTVLEATEAFFRRHFQL